MTDGLAATLREAIVPDLLASVPRQPSEMELTADEQLHRFVVFSTVRGHIINCCPNSGNTGSTLSRIERPSWRCGRRANSWIPKCR